MPYWRAKQPRDDWEIGAVQDRFMRATGGWGAIQSSIFGGWEPFTPPVEIPVVISEVPETWEELESLEPELFEPILETRPGQIPDHYPQEAGTIGDEWWIDPVAVAGPDRPPTDDEFEEEDDMAHDWGHLIRQGLGGLIGIGDPGPANIAGDPSGAGEIFTPPAGTGTVLRNNGDCDGMQWSGGVPPKGYKVVNSCGVGVLRKVRRRRRRRLLSASDSRDIATIVGLVGKGQMAASLINRR